MQALLIDLVPLSLVTSLPSLSLMRPHQPARKPRPRTTLQSQVETCIFKPAAFALSSRLPLGELPIVRALTRIPRRSPRVTVLRFRASLRLLPSPTPYQANRQHLKQTCLDLLYSPSLAAARRRSWSVPGWTKCLLRCRISLLGVHTLHLHLQQSRLCRRQRAQA